MKFHGLACAIAAQFALMGAAHAALIVAPVSATANVPTRAGGFSLEATFNQAGLASGYTAGVTDFDTYLAASPTHGRAAAEIWATEIDTPQAQVTYALGGLFDLQSFALWNRSISSQGIQNFSLIFSETADFASAVTVSGLTASNSLGANADATLAEIFTFAVVRAAFVRLDILSTYNTEFGIITFGEVIFEGAAASASVVPLPAALPLFIAGLAGLGAVARRRARRI